MNESDSQLIKEDVKILLSKVFKVLHGICSLYGLNSPCYQSTLVQQLQTLLSPTISFNHILLLSKISPDMIKIVTMKEYGIEIMKKKGKKKKKKRFGERERLELKELLKSKKENDQEEDKVVMFSNTTKKAQEIIYVQFSQDMERYLEEKKEDFEVDDNFLSNLLSLDDSPSSPSSMNSYYEPTIIDEFEELEPSQFLDYLRGLSEYSNQISHIHSIEAKDPILFQTTFREQKEKEEDDFDDSTIYTSFLPPNYSISLEGEYILNKNGFTSIYSHQLESLAHLLPDHFSFKQQNEQISNSVNHQKEEEDGGHVIITTPTASGKSLVFMIPIFLKLMIQFYNQDPSSSILPTFLLIFPTKALARDQLSSIQSWISNLFNKEESRSDDHPSPFTIAESGNNGMIGRRKSIEVGCLDGDVPFQERNHIISKFLFLMMIFLPPFFIFSC